MAVDPRKWIYSFIDHVPSVISKPARWIADRIFGIFDDGIEFARWIKSGFEHLRAWGIAAIKAARLAALETLSTLGWLLTQYLPAALTYLSFTLRRWATATIAAVSNGLWKAVSTLDKWIKGALSATANALKKLGDWLLGKINAITDRLKKTVDVWYERLTNPAKMAEWLIGALIAPFWRYAYANRDKITRWFLRRSPAFTAWLARELEHVLRRIL